MWNYVWQMKELTLVV